MMNARLRAGLVIAAIAISSAVAGAAVDRIVVQRMRREPPVAPPARGSPEEARRRTDVLDRMEKELGLTHVQRAGIDSVMRRTDSSLHVIRTEMQPRLQQEFEKSRTEISARLTAEQRAKLAKSGRHAGRGSGAARPAKPVIPQE